MAEYNVTIEENKVVGLLTESKAFRGFLETVLNQILQAQASDQLAAKPYERTGQRQGYRNGVRDRKLQTRLGTLCLQKPQLRDATFTTQMFDRFQRSEQAFALGLMQMCVQGVSTRKVTKITQDLCGTSFSTSTVSRLCGKLDKELEDFNSLPLGQCRYPFVLMDAMVVKVRQEGAIRSLGLLVAYGVNEHGEREVLGFWTADSESQGSWETALQDLKKRGLHGVEMVVSDAHKGLTQAVQKHLQGALWQRCQVHFVRNILSACPSRHRGELMGHLRAVLQAPTWHTARVLAGQLISRWEEKTPKAVAVFEAGWEDALAVLHLPSKYRQRLRTNNLAERVNRELRRRQRVICVFPNEDAAGRMLGALLLEQHQQWQSQHKYLDLDEFWQNKEKTRKQAA